MLDRSKAVVVLCQSETVGEHDAEVLPVEAYADPSLPDEALHERVDHLPRHRRPVTPTATEPLPTEQDGQWR